MIFPSVFLQTHNFLQTLYSFAEISSPHNLTTSSNERKLLDRPTTNIFSLCCSLTTHHPSSCNNLNISLSKHMHLLSLHITTFTLMKIYIANNNLHFLLLFWHEFTNTILSHAQSKWKLNTFLLSQKIVVKYGKQMWISQWSSCD